jgi:hypothetical protein
MTGGCENDVEFILHKLHYNKVRLIPLDSVAEVDITLYVVIKICKQCWSQLMCPLHATLRSGQLASYIEFRGHSEMPIGQLQMYPTT